MMERGGTSFQFDPTAGTLAELQAVVIFFLFFAAPEPIARLIKICILLQ